MRGAGPSVPGYRGVQGRCWASGMIDAWLADSRSLAAEIVRISRFQRRGSVLVLSSRNMKGSHVRVL